MSQITIANRYQIADINRDCVGHGGMGNVYRAVDTQTGQVVAVKQLHMGTVVSSQEWLARFSREAEALRRLNHPNIVSVLDTVETENDRYIIMEYVGGGSLQELLQVQPQLPVPQVLAIGLELADALTRAHHLNIVHRDIKPGNVLLAQDGTPRLTDFGMAQLEGFETITKPGSVTGTYAYLSPEACSGEDLDVRTDIWSFGVMLYEMLAGIRPFLGQHVAATLTAIMTKPVPELSQYRPNVPQALANLLYRMLEKERDYRIGSVRLVGAQLEAILSGAGTLVETGQARFDTTTPSASLFSMLGPRHNLPTQLTPFVGREAEVAELVALLDEPDCRLLTLIGPGGVGKTRLSLEVAARKVDTFKHGVRFIPLAPVGDPSLLITAMAEALNLSLSGESETRRQLLDFLRHKEILLVMDNFEHLLEGVEILSDILAQSSHVKILATSREALSLWEEWSRSVTGMAYPKDEALEDIETYSAVKLFTDRARRTRRHADLAKELPYIIQICRLVEGMPLAIELATSWLNVLSPAEIVAEIKGSIDFLATSMRNVEARHRSIRAVFDYSWQLLTEEEQIVFRRLSVFQGDFRRQAAQQVAGASILTLNTLVKKSLLQDSRLTSGSQSAAAGHRYRMHELVRQYAFSQLEDWGEVAECQQRHAHYYTQLVYGLEEALQGPDQKEVQDRLAADIENVRQAWQWIVEHIDTKSEALAYLAHALQGVGTFYMNSGLWSEWGQQLHQMLQLLDKPSVAAKQAYTPLHIMRGRIIADMANYYIAQYGYREAGLFLLQGEKILNELDHKLSPQDPDWLSVQRSRVTIMTFRAPYVSFTYSKAEAEASLQTAVQLCFRLEDAWHLSRVYNMWAILSDDNSKKLDLYRQSLTVARQAGSQNQIVRGLMNLALIDEDAHKARSLLMEALEIARHLENPTMIAQIYESLGIVAFNAADYAVADSYTQKALHMFETIGFTRAVERVFKYLSRISWAQGEMTQAQTYLEQALQMARESGDALKTIEALANLGQLVVESNALAMAKRLYKEAVSLLPQVATPAHKAEALDRLGNLAIDVGLYGPARQHFEENIPIFQADNNRSGVAWAYRNLGTIAYELGDFEAAQHHYEESLFIHRQINHAWAIMELLYNLGWVAMAKGENALTQRYYREALQQGNATWATHFGLAILVDWAALLMKEGQHGEALRYLYIVSAHPQFVPPTIHRRARTKLQRLTAELALKLGSEQAAVLQAQAAHSHYEVLVTEVLASHTPVAGLPD